MSALSLHELDQVATKRDLAELRTEMAREFGTVRSEVALIRDDLNARLFRILLVLAAGLFGIIATMVGVIVLG